MEKTKELTLKEQLEQAKANVKELERQMKLEAAKDVVAAVTKAITDDKHVSEVLADYTAEEGKIIGKRIVTNFDRLVEKSQDEIKALRTKKAEREARRRERQAQKKSEQKAATSSAVPVTSSVTPTVKQEEQKPAAQGTQTTAQQGQQQVQRPAQPQAAAVQASAQRQGNASNGYGQQAQSNGGIRYTPGT